MGSPFVPLDFLNRISFSSSERRLFPVLYQPILQQVKDYANELFDGNNKIEEVISPEDQDLIDEINAIIWQLERVGKKDDFLLHFPSFKKQRKITISTLHDSSKEFSEIRSSSNVGRFLSKASAATGAVATAASFVFPPVAPLTMVGAAASVVGGFVHAGTEIRESMLTQDQLNKIERVIQEDRRLLGKLGVSDFVEEMNSSVDRLFQTSDNIFDTIAKFLKKIPSNWNNIQFYRDTVSDCVAALLPRIKKFLKQNASRFLVATLSFTSLFVLFLFRRQCCVYLNLYLQCVAEGPRLIISNLITQAGVLAPSMLKNFAAGAAKGILIALDIVLIVSNSTDLKENDKVKMINEIAEELQQQLDKYQGVYDELRKRMLVEQSATQTQRRDIWVLLVVLFVFFLLNFPLLLILILSIFFVYFHYENK